MRISILLLVIITLYSCQKECPTCEKEECPTCEAPKECDSCVTELTRGLVAYYPFNGSANDESGNNLHAAAMNGSMLGTDFLGRQQSAAQFDGKDDYFLVPSSEKLNTDSVTISCVVMVNTINRRHTLVNKINFDDNTAFIYGVGQSLDTDNNYSFAVADKNEDCLTHSIYDNTKAVYSSSDGKRARIEAGRWYNVIATFGKDGQKIFIDGKLAGQLPRSFSSLKKCSAGNLLIGGWWKNDIISLDGKMDEVRVYNRVINQCEIDELAKIFN